VSRLSALAALAVIYIVRVGLAIAVFFARPTYFGLGMLLPLVITMSPQGIGRWLPLPVIAGGLVLCVNNARIQDRFESWLREEGPRRSDGRSDASLLHTLLIFALAALFLVLTTELVSFISGVAHLRNPVFRPNEADELANLPASALSRTIQETYDASVVPEEQVVQQSGREYYSIIKGLIQSFFICLCLVAFLVKWLNARCQT
jgi:hypothetical protein